MNVIDYSEAYPGDDTKRITAFDRPNNFVIGSKYGNKIKWEHWLLKEKERFDNEGVATEIRYRSNSLKTDSSIKFTELALFNIICPNCKGRSVQYNMVGVHICSDCDFQWNEYKN